MIPQLYAVLDADVALRAGWTLVDLASACFAGGARFVQIRAKGMPSGQLFDVASAVETLARQAGARLIVNDRADVARLVGAAGVHVGQEDLDPAAARTVVGAEAIVGVSTHTPVQWEAAVMAPVNYVAVGPIFGTVTKETGYEAVGLETVRLASQATGSHGLPLVAIGGITLDRAADVLGAGASAVAVISDLLATGDPAARVREYLERLYNSAA